MDTINVKIHFNIILRIKYDSKNRKFLEKIITTKKN